MPLFLQPLIKYFDFQGRARRAEYWQFIAFQFVVALVLGIMGSAGGVVISLLRVVFSLAMIIPSIAVAVRRFHDTGRTGWWYLFPPAVFCVALALYVPMAGQVFSETLNNFEHGGGDREKAMSLITGMAWILLAYLAAAFVTFVFHVLPGTEGANRFGDDPKGGGALFYARVFDGPADSGSTHVEPDAAPYKPIFDFSPSGATQQTPSVIEAAPARLPDIPVAPRKPAPQPPRPLPNAIPGLAARPTFGKRGI